MASSTFSFSFLTWQSVDICQWLQTEQCTYLLTCIAQVTALQPKLDALEAQWAQLAKVSNAKTAPELIAFWESERCGSLLLLCWWPA